MTSIRDICSCSKIDAKRGDHFPQADFTGLIPPRKPDSFRLADDTSGTHCKMVNSNVADTPQVPPRKRYWTCRSGRLSFDV